MADRLGAKVAMINGAGHYPHVEFPDHTSKLVLDFALTCERRGGAAAWSKTGTLLSRRA